MVTVNIYFSDVSRKPSICQKRKWKKTLQYDLNMLLSKRFMTPTLKCKGQYIPKPNELTRWTLQEHYFQLSFISIQKCERLENNTSKTGIYFLIQERIRILYLHHINKQYILSKQLFGIIVSNICVPWNLSHTYILRWIRGSVRQIEMDRVDVPSFQSVFTFCSFQLNHSHAYTSIYNI